MTTIRDVYKASVVVRRAEKFLAYCHHWKGLAAYSAPLHERMPVAIPQAEAELNNSLDKLDLVLRDYILGIATTPEKHVFIGRSDDEPPNFANLSPHGEP